MIRSLAIAALVAAALVSQACAPADARPSVAGPGPNPPPNTPSLSVSPSSVTVNPTRTQTFTASRSGAPVAVRWSVREGDAGGSVSTAAGSAAPSTVYTAPATTGRFTIVAFDPDAVATAQATVTVVNSGGTSAGRFAAMVAPVDGETFTAPATLRLVAAGRDPNIGTNDPREGLGGNAASVQFFVDDAMVLEVQGSQAEYWVFKGFTSGVAAGPHTVWARAIYVNPPATIDSARVNITVAAPSYGQTIELTGDLAVTAATHSWVGTPEARIRVNGNGHRITTSGPVAITWQYVDFHDLGDRSSTDAPGIDASTSGSLRVENCAFDWSNTARFTVTGSAPATVRGNTFRSNMRQPIGQYPGGGTQGSYPAVVLQGGSSGAKQFAGNNVGAGWVQFTGSATGWVVGGDSAADSNVAMGPRVGIYVDNNTSNMSIRRNYTRHIYFGGWSQGSNYELGGVATVTAEHNVIAGSSWPIRGVGGEFRYNLVLEAGHEWLWADKDNGYVHHNVFVGGDADIGGIFLPYAVSNVRIQNNTIDGMSRSSVVAAVKQGAGACTLTSNLFLNVPVTPVSLGGGSMTADYNLFWDTGAPSYSDSRSPAHDVHADPLLASPATAVYDFDEVAVWKRTLTVPALLAQYRARYAPAAGSPAIDAGDPALGAGNDIGAVGAGADNALDLFGK